MIPTLYDEKETAFTTNGIGKLCDAASCYVTEKRNGSYELKMTYASDGIHAENLAEGAIILAKPSERATVQPFRIYKITTPLTGILEIAARHIQYQENFITVSPFSAVGSQAAMAAIKNHVTTDCPFDFWTDIDSSATFTITSPATVRGCLGGMDGSMLDTYGGEYEWDMYTAMLHGHRGADHGVKIVYGKNLIDFKMERSIENMITGVHPYWKHSEDGTLMELPEKIMVIDGERDYEKISVLDCTSQFEEKPTDAQLRNYVKSYLKNTSLTEPDIDIKIDFAQLWQTTGYRTSRKRSESPCVIPFMSTSPSLASRSAVRSRRRSTMCCWNDTRASHCQTLRCTAGTTVSPEVSAPCGMKRSWRQKPSTVWRPR